MLSNLLIVAHPDDEIIFAGNLLLTYNFIDKVICVTNGDNKVRKSEFESVMKKVKVDYEIWDFHDEWKVDLDIDGIRKKLHNTLREKKWDMVLTHNEIGDNNYEHPHHKQVFECVKNEIVDLDTLYCFDNHGENLHLDIVKKKLKLLNLYKSQIKELGIIYIPMLESYFYKENFVKYNSL